ncbi:hypothetical protein [Streptomyces nigrescens]|uniref:hypothetical protein n=1 Tax=Streptomyces nigrescens TaxID=1920 RepID=UPI0021C2BD04|nr:hypothetical protein [Streptomyces nigrescens]
MRRSRRSRTLLLPALLAGAMAATAGAHAPAAPPAGAQASTVSDTLPTPTRQAEAVDLAHWMEQLRPQIGTRPLNRIAMPGSHDAGSWSIHDGSGLCRSGDTYDVSRVWPGLAASMAHTQSRPIVDQLDAGARYIDLRLCYQDGQWYTYHGGPLGGAFFDGPSGTGEAASLARWITGHPSEVVILGVRVTADAAELPAAREDAMRRLKALLPGRTAPYGAPGTGGLTPTSPYEAFLSAGTNTVLVDTSGAVHDPQVWPAGTASDRGSYGYPNPQWTDYLEALFRPDVAKEKLP